MDEFDRLMSMPRRCRVCGKACQGVRCGSCFTLKGRLMRFLKESGEQGLTEQRAAALLQVEYILRTMEKAGEIHESGQKWARGKHPDQVALIEAWEAKKGRASPSQTRSNE